MASSEHKLVEIDATTLSYPEWFFLWAAMGAKPDANLNELTEWRKRSLGMTPAQKHAVFQDGFESLRARGYIVQDTDEHGALLFHAEQPVYKIVGRIISRVTEFKPSLH